MLLHNRFSYTFINGHYQNRVGVKGGSQVSSVSTPLNLCERDTKPLIALRLWATKFLSSDI